MSERDLWDLGGGTVGGLLARRAAENPNKVAIICGEDRFTYAELDAVATRVAQGLRGTGARFGDSIGMFLTNRTEFLTTWLGLSRAGMVQVSVNTAYKGTFLEYSLDNPDVRVLVTESRLAPALAALEKLPASVETIVFVDEVPPDYPARDQRVMSWSEMLDLGDPDDEMPTVAPHDICAIQLTSGTTGKSKGVVVSQLWGVVAAREGMVALGTTPRDVLYTCLPMFHGAAQFNICLHAIYAGATAVLAPRFSASNFWNEIIEHEVTFFNALGSMLPALLAQPPSDRDRAHRVTRIFAAPAPGPTLFPFESRFGVRVIEGYGLTETKMMTYSPLEGRKVGSMGKPTASSIVEIHDDFGNPVPHGSVGEIVYRPRMAHVMFSHYYGNPEATLEATRGLWFHTGDLGYQDTDGFFYFVDRKKDALRRRGENISSQEVEAVLASYAGVLEAAAVATPSELGEDEILAVLETGGAELDLEDLFRHCDARLPHFMVPRFFLAVLELPRTPNNKVQKVLLRQEGRADGTWDAQQAGFVPTRQVGK